MRNEGYIYIPRYVKILILFTLVVATIIVSNMSVVKAEVNENTNANANQEEAIIHTHIWATKYDDKKHWEYCTVCTQIRNEAEHKCVDNWFRGKESCVHSNYSTRICECGYNYKYVKPHSPNDTWKGTGARLIHYKNCKECGNWTSSARCRDAEGNLSCKNTGTCIDCGTKATADYHYISKDGKCRDCGIQFIYMSKPTVKYSDDYSQATVKFSIVPKHNDVTLTGKMNAYTGTKNYTKVEWNADSNSEDGMDYTAVYTFDESAQVKATCNIGDITGAIKYKETNIYLATNTYDYAKYTIWQDHEEPKVTEIKQVDQTLHNTWATIKELTITGEDLSKIVMISITDPATGDIVIDKAKTELKEGKFSYKCTPPLEGPVEGRKYMLTVVDEIGNTLEKEFMIYKTDCRAPLLRSDREFVEWSQTKNIIFKLTDYGSGTAKTSMVNQTSYRDTEFADGYYNAKYSFAEDNYDVSDIKMYVKDGLGNAALEYIKVGKVDNTKPKITELKYEKIFSDTDTTTPESRAPETTAPVTTAPTTTGPETTAPEETELKLDKDAIGITLKISTSDMNTKLNREGSGVKWYAITETEVEPKDNEWVETGEIKITKPNKYYVWVKDQAGNIGDIQIVRVNNNYSMDIDPKDVIAYRNETEPLFYEVDIVEDEDVAKSAGNTNKAYKKPANNDEYDESPATADRAMLIIAATFMVISMIVAGVVIYKKKHMYRL